MYSIPLNSENTPWLYICPEGFFRRLILGRTYLRGGRGVLLLEGVLCFKNSSAYIWKAFCV